MRIAPVALRLPPLEWGRLEPVRDGVQRWLALRSMRERQLLGLLAAVTATVLVFSLVWQPLARAHARALADIRAYETLAARLRTAGPDVARMAASRNRSAATVITDAAARSGLTIRRLEPQGTRTEVTLEEVPFDKVADWLAALERDSGLTVASIKIERRPLPGIVTVQLTVQS